MGGSLHERTREHILSLSDEELADYLAAGTALYEPEAVEFAREEFARRNIEPGRAERITAEAAERAVEREARAEELALLPLTTGQRILSFLGGIFIGSILVIVIMLFAWSGFRQRGELRRAGEMWRFVLYGFGSVFLLGLLAIVYAAHSRS
jgi:hypothetical protein